jgi:hypothetical protein
MRICNDEEGIWLYFGFVDMMDFIPKLRPTCCSTPQFAI